MVQFFGIFIVFKGNAAALFAPLSIYPSGCKLAELMKRVCHKRKTDKLQNCPH
jgi:hypothetical protein